MHSALFVFAHVLKHSPDGESWRQSGGKVFEWVNNQVDPVGQTGNSHIVPSLSLQLCDTEKRHLKPENQKVLLSDHILWNIPWERVMCMMMGTARGSQLKCKCLSKWVPNGWCVLIQQCEASVLSATADTTDTHSFLSRAFSNSLVNKLFSPI